MTHFEYKKFEDLTIADLELLGQAYQRLIAEGYEPGFSYSDFLDIVTGRGEHEFNEFNEMQISDDLIKIADDWLIGGKF